MTGEIAATFRCKTCGRDAETIHFLPKGLSSNPCSCDAITYDFESETMEIPAEKAPQVRQAVAESDAAALYSAHPRFLATYCPKCSCCYCKKHWAIEDWPDPHSDYWSMHYDTFGTCPEGHRRLMAKDALWWPDDEPGEPLVDRP